MKTFRQILREAKKFTIEVEVRDAKRALEALKDDPNMKFKTDGTNFYIFKTQDDLLAAEDILKRAKIKIAELTEKKTDKALNFIADQLTNNDAASDAELILHLAKETHNPVGKISKLVKAERTRFMNNMMDIGEAKSIIKKYL